MKRKVLATLQKSRTTCPFVVEADDPGRADVAALIRHHLGGMSGNSPAGSVHALGLEALAEPRITLFTARRDGALAGIGALKQLDGGAGEIKSMRTHPASLRRGVALVLLDHIIAEARQSGMSTLHLETGSGKTFDAAHALYLRRGFVFGEAFGDYEATKFNRFMHLDLAEAR